jgi:hypothetical protein
MSGALFCKQGVFMAAGKRKESESFAAYRERLTEQAKSIRIDSKGVFIWNAISQGTYIKTKHGPIGTQR